MKSTLKNKLIVFGLPLIALGACSKANKTSVSLSIQGTQKSAAAAAMSAFASNLSSKTIDIKDENSLVVGSLVITKAVVSLKEIKFETEDDHVLDTAGEETAEETEDSFDFNGPYVVNLISDTVSPEIGFSALPAGNYTEIKLKLDKVEGDEDDEAGNQLVDASDPLFGNSIYVEGVYTGPSSTGPQTDIPFKMSFELDEEFELTGPGNVSNGINIAADTNVDVIIAFRLQKWFTFSSEETNSGAELSPSQIVVQGGEIILDEQASGDNDAIRDMIKENIKESADYGEDKDDDGLLGSDEDDDDDDEDDD